MIKNKNLFLIALQLLLYDCMLYVVMYVCMSCHVSMCTTCTIVILHVHHVYVYVMYVYCTFYCTPVPYFYTTCVHVSYVRVLRYQFFIRRWLKNCLSFSCFTNQLFLHVMWYFCGKINMFNPLISFFTSSTSYENSINHFVDLNSRHVTSTFFTSLLGLDWSLNNENTGRYKAWSTNQLLFFCMFYLIFAAATF